MNELGSSRRTLERSRNCGQRGFAFFGPLHHRLWQGRTWSGIGIQRHDPLSSCGHNPLLKRPCLADPSLGTRRRRHDHCTVSLRDTGSSIGRFIVNDDHFDDSKRRCKRVQQRTYAIRFVSRGYHDTDSGFSEVSINDFLEACCRSN